mgnify:CR=1 FL=1
MSPGIHDEPKVASEHLIQKIAHEATKNIPGAPAVVKKYFDKTRWNIPFLLKEKKPVNQTMHLGWG